MITRVRQATFFGSSDNSLTLGTDEKATVNFVDMPQYLQAIGSKGNEIRAPERPTFVFDPPTSSLSTDNVFIKLPNGAPEPIDVD